MTNENTHLTSPVDSTYELSNPLCIHLSVTTPPVIVEQLSVMDSTAGTFGRLAVEVEVSPATGRLSVREEACAEWPDTC